MTQEDKELLLKDLCGRLPYGVILQVGIFDNGDIKYHNKKLDYQLLSLIELDGGYYSNGLLCKYNQFTAKPYLRPMSSMTEEERKEYWDITSVSNHCDAIDWLNKKMFAYRTINGFDMFELGLALKAPEGMYD